MDMNQEEKRTEQCAYKKLDRMDENCKEARCDGYSQYCFKYVTEDHIRQFRDMFGRLDDIVLDEKLYPPRKQRGWNP